MSGKTYVVAGIKSWNRSLFESRLRRLPGTWHYVESPAALAALDPVALGARYVFFLHWSWMVPEPLTSALECVCFHPADLPYGRGGSPVQNLIVRGHRTTVLSAFRMAKGVDAGPVYAKEPLSLEGGAEEIFLRLSDLEGDLVERMVDREPVPVEQTGEPTLFKRRTPAQSELPADLDLARLHDFVRMLDAEGYPAAFLDHGRLRLRFRRSTRYADRVVAEVEFTDKEGNP